MGPTKDLFKISIVRTYLGPTREARNTKIRSIEKLRAMDLNRYHNTYSGGTCLDHVGQFYKIIFITIATKTIYSDNGSKARNKFSWFVNHVVINVWY